MKKLAAIVGLAVLPCLPVQADHWQGHEQWERKLWETYTPGPTPSEPGCGCGQAQGGADHHHRPQHRPDVSRDGHRARLLRRGRRLLDGLLRRPVGRLLAVKR